MAKNKMTTKALEGKYDENCLEENFGDLTWYKEVNDKGEVIENCLMQDVDGGVRGVDVFGNEHFDKVEYGKDKYNLTQLLLKIRPKSARRALLFVLLPVPKKDKL